MTAAEFHVGLLPTRPIPDVAELAREAEDLGFRGVWVADSQSVFRDAFAALTLCAERTDRLQLATGVSNPVTRHPAVLAGAIATLAEQSGDRATLGMGIGESAVRTIGESPAPLAHLEEVIDVVQRLLAGEVPSFQGREIRMSWPVRPAPIYLAASGPRSLHLGGRKADGVLFQVGADPALIRYALEAIQRGADEVSRDLPTVKKLVRLACVVSADGARARAEARGYAAAAARTVSMSIPAEYLPDDLAEDLGELREHYDYANHARQDAAHTELLTDRILDAVSVAGTPDEVTTRLSELLELGVDGFVIPIVTSTPRETLRVLGTQVLPRL